MLWGYWQQDLDNRHARHLNACLGQEIDRLNDLAEYFNVPKSELDRHATLKPKYWKLCPQSDDAGACRSHHAEACRYLHAIKR